MEENTKKELKGVVEQPAIAREKSLGRKLSDIFLSEKLGTVKNYIFKDVVIPAIKDTIVNIVQNGIEMLFYGNSGGGSAPAQRKRSDGQYVSYTSYYGTGSSNNAIDVRNRNRTWHSTRDIFFKTRGDADIAKAELVANFKRYKVVSVANLCQAAKVESTYMEDHWGWYDLEDEDITVRSIIAPDDNGRITKLWYLDMPKPMYLE